MTPFNIICSDGRKILVNEEVAVWLNSDINGIILSSIGYGIVISYFLPCAIILKQRIAVTDTRRIQNIALLLYIFIMFSLATMSLVSNTLLTQVGLNVPCYSNDAAITLNEIFSVSLVLTILAADAILLWRCIGFYRNCTKVRPWVLLSVPLATMILSLVSGTIAIVSSFPVRSLGSNIVMNSVMFYGCVTLSHNIIITAMIVTRLLVQRRQVTRALGPQYGSQYASIICMLIESASLTVVFGIITLVVYYRASPLANLSLALLSQVQVIAPLSIIYRVAKGSACATDTKDLTFPEVTHNSTTVLSANRFAVSLRPV